MSVFYLQLLEALYDRFSNVLVILLLPPSPNFHESLKVFTSFMTLCLTCQLVFWNILPWGAMMDKMTSIHPGYWMKSILESKEECSSGVLPQSKLKSGINTCAMFRSLSHMCATLIPGKVSFWPSDIKCSLFSLLNMRKKM